MNTQLTSWRELSAHLTDEQITEMEQRELMEFPPGVSDPEQLLAVANNMIRENEIQVLCAGIPVPPDCTGEPYRWIEWDSGIFQRSYVSWRRESGGCTVEILGYQYSDGRPIERTIWFTADLLDDLGRSRDDMDASQAFMCGKLLIEAAEELDRLNGDAPPF